MARILKKSSRAVGLAPGTLVHVGDRKVDRPKITLIDYDEDHVSESELISIDQSFPLKDTKTTSWINIDGLHDIELIDKVGRGFNIHSLVLEDILNTNQRPKYENDDEYIFISLKMLRFDENDLNLVVEQVSFVLGANYLITFQELPGDVFESVRERIRRSKGSLRKHGPHYLAYALIDAVVDNYFVVLEEVSEKIDKLEDIASENPKRSTLREIEKLKRFVIYLRRSIWPTREVIGDMINDDSKLIDKQTSIYLRDLHDHVIQCMDIVDMAREMLSTLLDIYLSGISNRLNEIMKVLTIFAAIFIPLMFITGIYGMNFEHMPELRMRFGYPLALSFMAIVACTMLFFFKRRKWF